MSQATTHTNGAQVNGDHPNLTPPLKPTRAASPTRRGGIVVFSGGSAANNLVDVFEELRAANQTTLSYVIPISDNGGSSSEIIRVFGGPGIGDVRSRLVRLIPDSSAESVAIRAFFNHRLARDYQTARAEWLDIVEAASPLWDGVSLPKQELIRSFLNVMNLEVVKRLRPSSRFDWTRLFTGSFEAAVYLLSSTCGVPSHVSVLPVLNTNFACHIAAGLTNGDVITGQNNISHPSHPTAAVPVPPAQLSSRSGYATPHPTEEADKIEDANPPGSLPVLRKPALAISKALEADLPARVERLWYINPYGQEIRMPANPRVLTTLDEATTVIYSIGSLFTSIIPSLVLRGVGQALADPKVKSKILILNGTLDRETGPSSNPFTALDFVAAVARAGIESRDAAPPEPDEYWQYVTHVIYMDSPASPKVDRLAFGQLGIETVRVYGRQAGRYDSKALGQVLDAIVGRREGRGLARRNTLVG
ncbi:hypothetical protein B0A48_01238 [Cryoendolithus antarcticus]|uniref:Uncharacterized protein n=1 Tax=Cryoendolithus antarcticus TaxID=1507870 RepID=A0A1V8TT67_9PEZI|nr:hypothetical protein B0A48_01238 [Cryoendolithus antarcticus]